MLSPLLAAAAAVYGTREHKPRRVDRKCTVAVLMGVLKRFWSI